MIKTDFGLVTMSLTLGIRNSPTGFLGQETRQPDRGMQYRANSYITYLR